MRRSASALFLVGFSSILGVSAMAGLPVGVDHFNVYNTTGEVPPAVFQPVTVADQFGAIVTGLAPPTLFLVPANKNNEGPNHPFSHLTCYDIGDPAQAPPIVTSTNQFGAQVLNLARRSSSACRPSS